MKPIFIVSPKFMDVCSVVIDAYAITLYPFIISREEIDDKTKRHEMIHFEQQKELFIVFFYLLYAYYYFINYLKCKDKFLAYLTIPFEREAYVHQNSKNYLEKRQKFSWINYLK